jgi:hypothetical protein
MYASFEYYVKENCENPDKLLAENANIEAGFREAYFGENSIYPEGEWDCETAIADYDKKHASPELLKAIAEYDKNLEENAKRWAGEMGIDIEKYVKEFQELLNDITLDDGMDETYKKELEKRI